VVSSGDCLERCLRVFLGVGNTFQQSVCESQPWFLSYTLLLTLLITVPTRTLLGSVKYGKCAVTRVVVYRCVIVYSAQRNIFKHSEGCIILRIVC
jgi:hypothetical protein